MPMKTRLVRGRSPRPGPDPRSGGSPGAPGPRSRRGESVGRAHGPGQAEGAPHRATHLRREAERPPILLRHVDRLDQLPVGRPPGHLTVPSLERCSRSRPRVVRVHRAASASRSGPGTSVHLVERGGAPAVQPAEDLARAVTAVPPAGDERLERVRAEGAQIDRPGAPPPGSRSILAPSPRRAPPPSRRDGRSRPG